MWGALVGPDAVFTGPGPTPSTVITSADEPPPEDGLREEAERVVRDTEPPAWLRVLVWLFEIVVLLGMLLVAAFLLRAAREAWRRRSERRRPVAEHRDFDLLDEPAAARDAIREDVAEQDAALRGGSPRNGIVAAWHRFEVQAGRAGLARKSWETSSEFALRLLDLAGAPPATVTALAELYREARFSDHDLDETARQRAIELLAEMRSGLGTGVR